MPCVLTIRRQIRVTHAPGEPDNRRGHVISVVNEILPADGKRTRKECGIIDVPDMSVDAASRLFLSKDYEAYLGSDPMRGGHHEKSIRQRSVRLDIQALRALLPAPQKPMIVAMFQDGFFVREADRISVPFDTLRKAFIVDRDTSLEIAADRTIKRKLQTLNLDPAKEEEHA